LLNHDSVVHMELLAKSGCLYIQDVCLQMVLQRHAHQEHREPTAAGVTVKG